MKEKKNVLISISLHSAGLHFAVLSVKEPLALIGVQNAASSLLCISATLFCLSILSFSSRRVRQRVVPLHRPRSCRAPCYQPYSVLQ